jgi:hypothetical protein
MQIQPRGRDTYMKQVVKVKTHFLLFDQLNLSPRLSLKTISLLETPNLMTNGLSISSFPSHPTISFPSYLVSLSCLSCLFCSSDPTTVVAASLSVRARPRDFERGFLLDWLPIELSWVNEVRANQMICGIRENISSLNRFTNLSCPIHAA